MVKLMCISRYQSAKRVVEIGETISGITPEEALFLFNDAPGCWADAEAEALAEAERLKAPQAPPADKMVRGATEAEMTLLTVATLRAQVQTGMDDTQLAALIEREEAEVIARYGAHYVDGVTPISEVCDGDGCSLYLKRRVGSISSITEAQQLGGTATALATSQYHAWPGQGRVARLPEGTRWGRSITVSYVPADDRPLRTQVLIELCRLAIEQTAMKSENVAGEYAFQAPDWERARQRLYRRLEFPTI